jgi:alpha-mannosidase
MNIDSIEHKTDGFVNEFATRPDLHPEAGLDIKSNMVIHVIPQAHIDLLWYWTPAEGIRMVLETLRAHADLLDANPDFTFAHSQAWSYDLVRGNDPELFERIRRLV